MANIFFLLGNDEFAISRRLKDLEADFPDPTTADMNTARLEARSMSEDDLNNAINAMPFLAKRRLVLLANPSVRKLISEGREADLPSVIRGSQREGMLDLTDNLVKLVQDAWIDPKDAYKYAPNTDELKMALKGIRTTAEGIL